MSFVFKPAVRENVGLLIGLAGASGSGKTYSAMRLASGIAGDRPFCVIDTEAGRAKHYADQFRFDHGDLTPPFSPDHYAEAIAAADAAGYPVIVVDSASHEHAGDGGILDMQQAEFERLGSREAVKMLSWAKPKSAHKKMVQRLLQVRAHLILCFRAEEKIEMRKVDGRLEVVPKETPTGLDGWVPICEKTLPFELTCSFLMLAKTPGIPTPIKLQQQHRDIFLEGKPIDEDCGRRLAAWASGGQAVKPAAPRSGALPDVPILKAALERYATLAAEATGATPADALAHVCSFTARGETIRVDSVEWFDGGDTPDKKRGRMERLRGVCQRLIDQNNPHFSTEI